MDDQRSQLSEAFYVGQSVRSNILDVGELSKTKISQTGHWTIYLLFIYGCFQVNNETSRITVSLKQSCCSSTDACFLQEYFLLENKVKLNVLYLIYCFLFPPVSKTKYLL